MKSPIGKAESPSQPSADPIVEPRRLLITVHGIRTLAPWQGRLERQLETEFGGDLEISHYKYGYFWLFGILFPPARWIAVKRFRSALASQIERNNWSRVDIIAHSFGTYLVGWGLLGMPKPERPIVHTVIFAASVLKHNFPVDQLVDKYAARLVNECGTRDNVLLWSYVTVLFCGMAGRTGIVGMEGRAFLNRYFNIAHSDYFKDETNSRLNFIGRYWVPLLRSDTGIASHEERNLNQLGTRGWAAMLLQNLGPIKAALYLAPFITLFLYVNHLRLSAKREANIAFSRLLAAESALLRADSVDLQPATLLAAESMERAPQLANDEALRDVTSILPHGNTWGLSRRADSIADAFSNNGKYLISGHIDGRVGIYDAVTGTEISHNFTGKPIFAVALSSDNKIAVAAGGDNTAVVFDVGSGKVLAHLVHRDNNASILSIAISPDARYVATACSDNVARLFEIATGKEVLDAVHDGIVKKVIFSPDGKYLLTGGYDNTVRAFHELTGRLAWKAKVQGTSEAMAIAPNGKYVAVGSDRGHLEEVSIDSGKPISSYVQPVPITVVAFSPDGNYLSTGSGDGTVRIFAAANLEEISRFTFEGQILSLGFSPDGRYIVAGSEDHSIRVLESQTGREVSRLRIASSVLAVSFSFDGQYVDGSGESGTLSRFRLVDATSLNSGPLAERKFTGCSEDNRLCWFGKNDGSLHFVNAENSQTVAEVALQGVVFVQGVSRNDQYVVIKRASDAFLLEMGTGRLTQLSYSGEVEVVSAFGRDGRYIAVGIGHSISHAINDGIVRVFDTVSGSQEWQRDDVGGIISIDISRDGRYIATGRYFDEGMLSSKYGETIPSGSSTYTAIVYDLKTGNEVSRLNRSETVAAVAFSSDGSFVATGSNEGVARVFVSSTGQEISRMGHPGGVTAVSFNGDGRYVATVSADKRARVFETFSGIQVSQLSLGRLATSVEFSAGDKYIVVSGRSPSGVAITKGLFYPQDLIDFACSLVTRNLSADEWRQYVGGSIAYHKTCPKLP